MKKKVKMVMAKPKVKGKLNTMKAKMKACK